MKRALRVGLAALGLATVIGTSPAIADDGWAFDAPYWQDALSKRSTTRPAEAFTGTSADKAMASTGGDWFGDDAYWKAVEADRSVKRPRQTFVPTATTPVNDADAFYYRGTGGISPE